MYAAQFAISHPTRAAFIMASTGETITYAELEKRSNKLAHLFRQNGLKRLDHYAMFMENNNRYIESCVAGERSGLYYTCVNSYLKAEELAYILNNSESKALITSMSRLDVARQALKDAPNVKLLLVVDAQGDCAPFVDFGQALAACRRRPSPMNGSARRCCIRRAPREGLREFFARSPTTRLRSLCRYSIS